ncbi:Hypothetical predicted protein [Octopus vulgaris]|uniref:Uncharacterized protein n=1 Tax=Octopus vulgaris TaxID=6645 RepID=A0AA36BEK5_OCTVU|nr:Hypothetical predicted protein [Octopus vulgaris]
MFRIGVVLMLLVILGLTNGRVMRQKAVQLQQTEVHFNFTGSSPLRLKRAAEKKFKFVRLQQQEIPVYFNFDIQTEDD